MCLTENSVIASWKEKFGINLPVVTKKISRKEVTGEDGRPGASLVGVVIENDCAIILHTRKLTEEDIVHELLHVAHPSWTEEEVVLATKRFVGG